MVEEGAGAHEGPHTSQPFSDPHSAFMLQDLWPGQVNFCFLNWMEERCRLTSGGGWHSKWSFPSVLGCPLARCLFRSSLWGSALDFLPPSHGSLRAWHLSRTHSCSPRQDSYSLDLCFPQRLKSGVTASLLGCSRVSRLKGVLLGFKVLAVVGAD